MPDESSPHKPSKVVPSHLLDPTPLREPSAEEIERFRWEEKQLLGRHGYAAKGTAITAVVGGTVLGVGNLVPTGWLVAAHGDGLLWMLLIGVPALAAVYRVLLARWDQEAERFGAGRVSLDAWRAGDRSRDDGEGPSSS